MEVTEHGLKKYTIYYGEVMLNVMKRQIRVNSRLMIVARSVACPICIYADQRSTLNFCLKAVVLSKLFFAINISYAGT